MKSISNIVASLRRTFIMLDETIPKKCHIELILISLLSIPALLFIQSLALSTLISSLLLILTIFIFGFLGGTLPFILHKKEIFELMDKRIDRILEKHKDKIRELK